MEYLTSKLKQIAKTALAFAMINPLQTLIIVAGVIAIVVLACSVQQCNSRRTEKKLNDATETIIENKIEQGITEVNIKNAQNEVKNAETNTNIASDVFNDIVNRDSSEWAGFDDKLTTDRFCRRFCWDSSCLEWLKANPEIKCSK